MADQKLSDLPSATPAGGDLLYLVDVSDTADSPQGSSRKVTVADVLGLVPPITASSISDSTPTGRALLTAADAPTARSAIGTDAAGTVRPPTAHTHPLSNLDQSGATVNQVPQWNGTAWVPATVSGGGGGGGAPTNATYVTLTTDGTLSDERVLTAGAGITVTDGGAGGPVTVANADRGSTAVANHVAATDPHPGKYLSAVGPTVSVPWPIFVDDNLTVNGDAIVVGEVSAGLFRGFGLGLTNLNAGALASGTVPVARLPVGTTAGTVAAGDDSRLSDARTPTGPAGGDLTGTYPNPTLATVPVAKGGTGATTAPAARTNLGFVTLTTTSTSGTVTIDLSAADITYVLSLTSNVTLALSNEADGRRFTLFVRGQASGFTVTWFAGIKWSGGAAPTLPTVSGRVLPVSFIRLASGEWLGIPGQECY